ncbi:uncharacterized protein LOC130420168 isoform X3 [Triplophysa dalaica]|uniref:uncharacterized protein LOC130420168 isoform X3 n=1 Tax=Triplophysa dalaica TaxID=1582913 RepID=UPI0024E02C6E|nr:uncharacterized protein LOC130420168 isoform X3 [Triplophysa dalaica]
MMCLQMLTMEVQLDVICCKSVGTDLSMLDIENFITEICRLKKKVASLEAKLRERGDKLDKEDLRKVSVCVTDRTEAQDSVLRSRDTQNPELSLKLLCYADAQDDGSADETSYCNAGEQQMQQTQQNMCSVKLVDCRNLIESRGEKNTAEEQQQQQHHEDDDGWIDDDENDGTEAKDSVWRPRDKQDTELSHTLLCYSDAQVHKSSDETSDCNAGEQQMPLKMCSVKLVDYRNLIEGRGEKNIAEEQQHHHEDDDDWIDDDENDGTEAQDSVWRSRDTQDSDSDTSLCYTDARNDRSADETSDFNAGEQQMQQTQLKMCSVRLVDCKNLIESREEKQSHENDNDDDDGDYNIDYDDVDDDQNDDDEVFFPSDVLDRTELGRMFHQEGDVKENERESELLPF